MHVFVSILLLSISIFWSFTEKGIKNILKFWTIRSQRTHRILSREAASYVTGCKILLWSIEGRCWWRSLLWAAVHTARLAWGLALWTLRTSPASRVACAFPNLIRSFTTRALFLAQIMDVLSVLWLDWIWGITGAPSRFFKSYSGFTTTRHAVLLTFHMVIEICTINIYRFCFVRWNNKKCTSFSKVKYKNYYNIFIEYAVICMPFYH